MNVMDTIMTVTRCVSSVLVALAVLDVAARIVAVVGGMVVVMVMHHVADSQAQALPLGDQTTESKCLVCQLYSTFTVCYLQLLLLDLYCLVHYGLSFMYACIIVSFQ